MIGEELDRLIIKDILKEKYPEIYKALEEESFILHCDECTVLDELKFEDKVVGFASFTFSNFMSFYLTNIFILPEYRHNGLFYDLINNYYLAGRRFSIYRPSRSIVELLVKYDFAYKISDNLVISAIDFILEPDELLSKTVEIDVEDDSFITCNLYDFNICSPIVLNNISTPGVTSIFYSRPLKEDMEDFNCLDARRNIGVEYFKNIKYLFLDKSGEFVDKLFDLRSKLPKPDIDIHKLLGENDVLSEFLESVVTDELSYERMREIKKQLLEEFGEGKVLSEDLLTRLNYLIAETFVEEEDWEDILDDVVELLSSGLLVCPYCYLPYNPIDTSCRVCGYNLNYESDISKSGLDFDDSLHSLFEFNDNSVLDNISHSLFDFKREVVDEDSIGDRFSDDELDFHLYEALYLFNKGCSLDMACHNHNFVPDNIFSDFILSNLLECGYVSLELNNDNWYLAGHLYTVGDLKQILRDNNLKVSGKKQILMDRICDNLVIDWDAPDYFITSSGFKFLDTPGVAYYFVNFLRFLDFDEFCDYYYDNFDDFGDKIVLSFLDLKEIEAFNKGVLRDCLDIIGCKAKFYCENSCFEDALFEELRYFICYMNLSSYTVVNHYDAKENIRHIGFLVDKLNLDSLDDFFRCVWDSLSIVFVVPFDVCFDCLLRFLDDGFMVKTFVPILKKYFSDFKAREVDRQSSLFDF